MIPIQLTIEGLYSYQERQTIDFSQLTSAGLFGIFGAVGSGKSSILEAITYALYGDSERMNSKDKLTYNMMNLKSSQLYIELDFYNFEDRKFRITRELKRNGKNFEKITNNGAVLYEKINHQWIAQSSSEVAPIIGLSAENFRRTIIIPQGKFKEFIDLKGTERTNMMKELFGLQRFDLSDKTKILQSENTTHLDQLTGKLQGYDIITEENIQALQHQIEVQQPLVAQLKSEVDKFQQQVHSLKELKADFEAFTENKIALDALESQLDSYQQLEKQTQQFILVKDLFSENIATEKRLSEDLNLFQIHLKTEQEKLQKTTALFAEFDLKWAELASKIELRPQQEKIITDLNFIKQLVELTLKNQILTDRIEQGKKVVQTNQENIERLKDKKLHVEKEHFVFKEQMISPDYLLKVQDWYNVQRMLITTSKSLEEQLKNTIEQDQFERQITSNGYSLLDWEKELTEKIQLEKRNIQSLEERQLKITLKQQISHYAANLVDGEPCPLCGAEHHPNIAHSENVSVELAAIDLELKKAKLEEKTLERLFQNFEISGQQHQKSNLLIAELTTKLAHLADEITLHRTKFVFKELEPTDENGFNQLYEVSTAQQQKVQQSEIEIQQLQQTIEQTFQKNLDYERHIQQFIAEEKANQSSLVSLEQNLKTLKFQDYKLLSIEAIDTKIQQLHLALQRLIAEEKDLLNQKEILTAQRATEEKAVKIYSENVHNTQQQIEHNAVILDTKIAESTFENKATILAILNTPVNITENQQKINDFTVQLTTLRTKSAQLNAKLSDKIWDSTQLAKAELQFETVLNNYEKENKNFIVLNSELDTKIKQFEQKKELLKQFEQLETRKANLSTLLNLFKSQGFVEYVSRIYLMNLCKMANVRFHKMTKNQLSLTLNEQNDFQVIDYLNNGKQRSVKTLSGGQSFQVALALALALAENIQSMNQAKQNFFFIDEGFGTQDLASINIVFETLQALQKENRIVGIISHVEELKEKIPLSLTVTNHPERGSILAMDY